jgi:hypothetical protein
MVSCMLSSIREAAQNTREQLGLSQGSRLNRIGLINAIVANERRWKPPQPVRDSRVR